MTNSLGYEALGIMGGASLLMLYIGGAMFNNPHIRIQSVIISGTLIINVTSFIVWLVWGISR